MKHIRTLLSPLVGRRNIDIGFTAMLDIQVTLFLRKRVCGAFVMSGVFQQDPMLGFPRLPLF